MRSAAHRFDRREWLAGAALCALFVLAHVFHARQGGDLSVQSELNLRFVGRPSLATALERYPKLRPPLYPVLLWVSARLGVSGAAVNEVLLDLTLCGLLLAVRRARPAVHPVWPVAAYALAHFNYANLQQLTAEALFVPLLLAVLLLLARYQRSGSHRDVALLAAALSALCLTRYFALTFAVPLVMAHVVLRAPAPPRRRLAHGAVLLLGLLPIVAWMAYAHGQTGYWTGAERGTDRVLPEAVRHWSALTTLPANVLLMARTVFVDFFSPRVYAAHSVVTHPLVLSPFEWAAASTVTAAAVALVGLAVRAIRMRPKDQGLRPALAGWMRSSVAVLAGELLAAYVVLTLVVWTLGNNDPLYTRFLFPAYVLLFVVAVPAYAAAKAHSRRGWLRLPLLLLLGFFLAAQVSRQWRAEALPVRFVE